MAGIPNALFIFLLLHPHKPTSPPVVETPQVPTDLGGHNPGLRYEKNYRLHNCFVKRTGGLGVRPLLVQDPVHTIPLPPGLTQV